MPATQTCPVGQTIAQLPQLFGSVLMLTHALAQYFWPAPLQLQAAPTQSAPPPQTLPHMPQLLLSKFTSVQFGVLFAQYVSLVSGQVHALV